MDRCEGGIRWKDISQLFNNLTEHYNPTDSTLFFPSDKMQVDLLTFKLKMRYKKTEEWHCHLQADFILSSPSLAEGFIQICLDGIEEVCSIDVVLVQLDTEKARQDRADQKIQHKALENKAIKKKKKNTQLVIFKLLGISINDG